MRVFPAVLTVLVGCFEPDTSRIQIIDDAGANAGTDLSSPQPDGGNPSGCAAGGQAVGAAWACPGKFTVGHAKDLCQTGFTVCTSASGIDLSKCDMTPGFYAADAPGYDGGFPDLAMCGPDPGGSNRDYFGCGGRTANVSVGKNACKGFVKVLSCQPSSGWDCFSGPSIDKTANNNNADGVLCCKV